MTRLRTTLFFALFFLSGSAGLGYQMVWSKMFGTGLGHEIPAVLAIVSAFMGGMALGAWKLDGVISRSPRPGRWYGWLEILIGLWGVLSAAVIPFVNQSALQLIGVDPSALRHWSVAFLLPLLALLPATAAMGATLPAMERFLSPWAKQGRCVGALYAVNTLGAVAGTLLSAFVLGPALGFRGTVFVLAAINLLCGVVVLLVEANTEIPKAIQPQVVANVVSPKRLGATVFFTGLLGIGFEAITVRVLSQVLENTVFTFAAVLSIFLLGTSLGAAFYQRFHRRVNSQLLLTDLLGAAAVTCVLGVFALARAQSIYDASRAQFGDTKSAVLAAEMLVTAFVLLLPTICMGAVFSHLVQAARTKAGGVGWAIALNTFGGALAPAFFGVMLLPTIGSKWTLVLISLAYLALLPKISGWRWGILAAPLILTFGLPAKLQIVPIPPDGRLAEFREGVMSSVAVIEDATRHRTLRVDNRFQMGGTSAALAEYRHAHIPLLLHPAPKRALFLGLGTGITFGAASLHPNLKADGVELVPEIIAVLPQFEPFNFSPARNPQLKLHIADARRFVRSTDERYDVIVADLFHPARDGAGSLYTLEHFQAIRQRLQPGGLFCQWLPLHQLDEPMLQIVVRTFLEVFPDAQAYLLRFNVDAPVLGLVGLLEPPRISSHWIENRLSDPRLEEQLKKLTLADSVRFFGSLIAGPKGLREFAANASLNTDDQPRILFGAPQFTYQKNSTSYGRLLALLNRGIANPREVFQFSHDSDAAPFAQRLSDYMTARNVYLRGLVEEVEGHSARAIDAFVESARLSPDFTPGYAQCLTIASLQAKARPGEARALLQRLIEAQPSKPIAGDLLNGRFH